MFNETDIDLLSLSDRIQRISADKPSDFIRIYRTLIVAKQSSSIRHA